MVTKMPGSARRKAATSPVERRLDASPVFRFDAGGRSAPMTSAWPLSTYLELAAMPSAVPCARLHARQVAWEWGLGALAETVELVVSEIVTNAIRASVVVAGDRCRRAEPAGVPVVRLLLATNRRRALVQVWDGCPSKPQRQHPGPDVESGRGLLLIEALSADWGTYAPAGCPGKIVWCVIADTDMPRTVPEQTPAGEPGT